MTRKSEYSTFYCAVVAVWLLAVSSGAMALWNYAFSESRIDTAVGNWPDDSSLICDSSVATLVVFIHPQCPCTKATIRQLLSVQRHSTAPFRLQLVMLQPESGPVWRETPVQRHALAIRDAEFIDDRGGREAVKFGVSCSGMCLLFSPDRSLLFRGGITESRGHEGDCMGANLLLAHLNNLQNSADAAPASHNPVYGCSLVSLD